MSTELIVFPDTVAAVVAGLNDRLTEVGYPTVTAVGRVPKPRPDRFVRVLRLGGAVDGLVVDDAMLTVEAWAESDYESARLAQAARAVVNSLAGTVVDGITVYGVKEFSGPGNLPDPDSTQSRHTWTVEVSCRGAVA